MRKIGEATFTRFDETQANACIDNRAILFQLWDLATTYPCIASKIEVRIRQADPREDYEYEESMSDSAIVVNLRWFDTADACKFLRCHASYPQDGTSVSCSTATEPRVYPSGDVTTVTSCEPACFFGQHLTSVNSGGTAHDESMARNELESTRYSSDQHLVRSVRDGNYRRTRTIAASSNQPPSSVDGGWSDDAKARVATDPDLSLFEYVRRSNTCELTNHGLIDYITQPIVRGGQQGKEECRVTNFAVGEDLLYNARIDGSSLLPPGNIDGDNRENDVYAVTGRLSSSYCDAFAKRFDPVKRTCVVPWWETALSYTFLGSALIRLARHAVQGGDRCDQIFPASESRAETNSKNEDARLLSRREWFNDVDRSWVCPPPNVTLSDLGVKSRGEVWTNRHGGSVERAVPSDYSTTTETSSSYDPHSGRSRRRREANDADVAILSSSSINDSTIRNQRTLLQFRRSSSANLRNDSTDAPFLGAVIAAEVDTPRRRRRAAMTSSSSSSSSSSQSLLNFDEIYGQMSSLRDDKSRGSDIIGEIAATLAREVGIVSAQLVVERWLTRLMKSAYNRSLRFVGQRLAGTASRTLVALSVRIGTARMISAAMSGLSTRVMLALGSASTGIGAIVAAVEMLSFALDMALLLGWDPGHYNAEIGNDTFDGFALAWARMRTRERVPRLDPYYVLLIYNTAAASSSSQAAAVSDNVVDESAETTPRSDRRFNILAVEDAPWFFEPFSNAVRAMIEDQAPVDPTVEAVVVEEASSKKRVRPIFADSPVICNLLWTIHYFSHRTFNSNGQRVRVGKGNDVVEIDDDVVRDTVRSNELAAFLNESTRAASVPRASLIGAARRNFLAKSVRLTDHIIAIASFVFGATFSSGGILMFSPRSQMAALWLLAFALLLVVLPMTFVPTIVEMIAAPDGGVAAVSDRMYDRRNDDDRDDLDRLSDDFANTLINAARTDSSPLSTAFAKRFVAELRVINGGADVV